MTMKKSYNLRNLALLALFAFLVTAPVPAGEYPVRMEKSFDLAPGGRFEIESRSGAIDVVGTDLDGVRLVIRSKYEDLDDRFNFVFETNSDEVVVKVTKKGESRLFSWFSSSRSGALKFEVEVPRQTRVDLDTAGGSIHVRDLEGETLLDTSGGRIVAENIYGDLNADTSGGSIKVSAIQGDAILDTSGGGISAVDVTGDVSADTSGGSIHLEQITGNIDADTSGGGIKIREAGSYVRADTSGGSILVVFAMGNDRGGHLSSSGGSVTAEIDPAVSLDIAASSSGGGVTCDVPITVQGRLSKTSVRGTLNGGGETLHLSTSGGGARVRPR